MRRAIDLVKTKQLLPSASKQRAATHVLTPNRVVPPSSKRPATSSVKSTPYLPDSETGSARVRVTSRVGLPSRKSRSRHAALDAHGVDAAPPPGKARGLVTPTGVLPSRDLHAEIAHVGRALWDVQKTRVQINNRMKAMERDGLRAEWTMAIKGAVDALEEQEAAHDRHLVSLVKHHPLSAWVAVTPGLGLGGLGRLLACTGSLDNFANVAKLWAFLGMHVVGGRAPKRQRGQRANWSRQGRVVCHQIGDAIVKLGKGKYRADYDRKRGEYLARPLTGPSGCPFGQEHKGDERVEDEATGWNRKTGEGRIVQCVKTDAEGKKTSAHVHNAAMRYAVKELLKDMWVTWQRVRPERS